MLARFIDSNHEIGERRSRGLLNHANRQKGIPTPKKRVARSAMQNVQMEFARSAMQSGGMQIHMQAMGRYMVYHLKGK
jgi:hypothetical protein